MKALTLHYKDIKIITHSQFVEVYDREEGHLLGLLAHKVKKESMEEFYKRAKTQLTSVTNE